MNYCTVDDIKIQKDSKLFLKIKNPKTFIVELFPYFCGNDDGNIAKYARGEDYHIVVQKKLKEKIEMLKIENPQNEFISFCDISDLPEVEIAYKSGAGILGKNGLIFDEEYGGYVFIGIIATDLELDSKKNILKKCIACNLCIKACPTNALTENGVCEKKCLSYLTQTNDEICDISKAKYVWGCDVCLDICPMNMKIKHTYIKEFKENLIKKIELDDIYGLSRKKFCQKYPNRAFTYRGPAPIIRNLKQK